jgi:hypothetical protein
MNRTNDQPKERTGAMTDRATQTLDALDVLAGE